MHSDSEFIQDGEWCPYLHAYLRNGQRRLRLASLPPQSAVADLRHPLTSLDPPPWYPQEHKLLSRVPAVSRLQHKHLEGSVKGPQALPLGAGMLHVPSLGILCSLVSG